MFEFLSSNLRRDVLHEDVLLHVGDILVRSKQLLVEGKGAAMPGDI